MPNAKEQHENAPYSCEYIILDQIDSSNLLFRDMMKIATGRVPQSEARKFAEESVRAAMVLTQNAVTLEIK